MTLTKKQLVAQLKEISRLLEVLGEDPYRAKAFQNAARQLDSFQGDALRLLYEDRLTEIRGIGGSLAGELAMLKERDELPLVSALRERVPEGVRRLFAVSGLGAKKIAALWQSGITDLQALEEAARDGRLAAMKGFGKKSAENIAAAAAFALEASRRYRLDVAEAYAVMVGETLTAGLPGARVAAAGQLRRALETVEVLEFVIAGTTLDEVADQLSPMAADVTTVTGADSPGVEATLDGRPLRLTLAEDETWGVALAHRTGSPEFWKTLEDRAAEKGLELTPGGLRDEDELLATPDEAALFEALELPFIVPELREPEAGAPPERLVTLEDVRGLVHNHTSWSDGAVSMSEMAAAAQALGYRYLAIADHSKSSYVANGLSAERVLAQMSEVAALRDELGSSGSDLQLLHGLEVDIMPDGRLDLPDEVLAQLDYCVVSVHQSFQLSEAEQTERIVRAVQNPHASILAHPSGRLLLGRPPYEVDLEAVIEACAETRTVIEINANPRRLDLDWRWVTRAREMGCRFSINPDAHHPDGYHDVRYGVMMARKAGLQPQDVVNTAPDAGRFLALLKRAGVRAGAK